MLRHLYSLLLLLAVPFIITRLLIKSSASPAYRQRISERFGLFTLPTSIGDAKQVVWLHAVSVGETVAAAPLVKALLEREGTVVVLTTTTPTGADRAQALFGDTVHHLYAPYDLGIVIRGFLARVKPQLLIIMETELWPNMLHYCQARGVKTLLANARMSARSARGYQRFRNMTAAMLESIDAIAAQSDDDQQRLIDLGATKEKIRVTGSLKFHVHATAETKQDAIFQSVANAGRPVVIAASTRAIDKEHEETKVLDAWSKLSGDFDKPLLLLVPRHPERFAAVAELCREQGWSVQRRSEAESLAADTDILLGDSMGELMAYYSLADIAFVGGSLVDTGCQNVLEPAAIGLPIVVGASQFNFATICKQLEEAGALQTVTDSDELAQAISGLLANREQREEMAEAGRNLVAANQQALPQLLIMIEELRR